MSAPSSALDRPSSLLGKAAGAQGSDTARSDERTVKYLACGRKIVQQETKLWKASGITSMPQAFLSLRVLHLADDLAGIATGELKGVSQLNKEAQEKRFRT